jgi:hypothetical protein
MNTYSKLIIARREKLIFFALAGGFSLGIALTFLGDLNRLLDMAAAWMAPGFGSMGAWVQTHPLQVMMVFPVLIAAIYVWQARNARRYF